jgi:hypothetical protein
MNFYEIIGNEILISDDEINKKFGLGKKFV